MQFKWCNILTGTDLDLNRLDCIRARESISLSTSCHPLLLLSYPILHLYTLDRYCLGYGHLAHWPCATCETLSEIGKSSHIRVSSSGAWIPYGRLYKGLRIRVYPCGPQQTRLFSSYVHGSAEISDKTTSPDTAAPYYKQTTYLVVVAALVLLAGPLCGRPRQLRTTQRRHGSPVAVRSRVLLSYY